MIINRLLTGVVSGAFLILLFLYVGQSCELADLQARTTEAERARDRLAAEAAVERARADGWETRFGEVVPDLQGALAEAGDSLGRLATDLRASRVRVEELLRATVTAGGSIESAADSSEVASEGASPDRSGVWVGRVDDGLLAASWRFQLPQESLGLDYQVSVPVELTRSVTGDGQVLVTARSANPRAEITLDELLVDPPPPVEVERTNWSATAWVAGGMTLACYLLCPRP